MPVKRSLAVALAAAAVLTGCNEHSIQLTTPDGTVQFLVVDSDGTVGLGEQERPCKGRGLYPVKVQSVDDGKAVVVTCGRVVAP